MVSKKELSELLFEGKPTYYYFDTDVARHYCFDSEIDFTAYKISNYQNEQLLWFANDLLTNSQMHSSIFIHIPTVKKSLTPFMKTLGTIVEAYNSKTDIVIMNTSFDYRWTEGKIDFFQAGHTHEDINDLKCGSIPVIVTRNFPSTSGGKEPLFDIINVNY